MVAKKSKRKFASKKSKTDEKKKGRWGGERTGAGRPAELEGSQTKSVVLDAYCIETINRVEKIHGEGFSSALRWIINTWKG